MAGWITTGVHPDWTWGRGTREGQLEDAARPGGQGSFMKGLMCLAMEFRLCPIKRWEPGKCFELRNDMVRLML